MDKIDHRILTLLEDDARQSFAELGEQVALSKTPCWQRVREGLRTHQVVSVGHKRHMDLLAYFDGDRVRQVGADGLSTESREGD